MIIELSEQQIAAILGAFCACKSEGVGEELTKELADALQVDPMSDDYVDDWRTEEQKAQYAELQAAEDIKWVKVRAESEARYQAMIDQAKAEGIYSG